MKKLRGYGMREDKGDEEEEYEEEIEEPILRVTRMSFIYNGERIFKRSIF